MIPIDSRSLAILTKLLDISTPLTKQQIADELQITPRMVGYRLQRLRGWLIEHDMELGMTANHEVYLIAPQHLREKLLLELKNLSKEPIIWSADERCKLLTFHLLTEENPTIMRSLQSIMGVSRPTISKDLGGVEEWLRACNIDLIKQPGYGIEVRGAESKKREAIATILLRNLSSSYIQSFSSPHTSKPKSTSKYRLENSKCFKAYLENLHLPTAARYVRRIESHLFVRFTDASKLYLLLLLAISVVRINDGYVIQDFSFGGHDLIKGKELDEARKLFQLIELEHGVIIPEEEMGFFAVNLCGSKLMPSSADLDKPRTLALDYHDPLVITEKFLSKVALHLHPIIRIDRRLIQNLAIHMRPILVRLKYDLPIQNPFLEEVQDEYPFIFKVAKKCSKVIEDAVGCCVPDEEVGYIVLHIAAALKRLVPNERPPFRVVLVCGTGMATVWLMVSKLKCMFPQIQIVDILSESEIYTYNLNRNRINLVISTVPIKNLDNSVIEVSPFLSPDDINEVRTRVEKCYENCSIPPIFGTNGPGLSDLITDETIQLGVRATSWKEAIKKAGYPLRIAGAIDQHYIHSMIDLIKKYGAYAVVADGVIILHAQPKHGVNRVCMSLTTFETPIEFGHPKFDPVRIAFVIGTTNDFMHIIALQQLASLVGEISYIEKLYLAKDANEVISVLGNYIEEQGSRITSTFS